MSYRAPILYNKNNKQFYISLNKKQIPLLKKTHPKFIDIENYKFEYEKE